MGAGLVMGGFAGAMAFLITYEEYRQHFLHPRPALRQALHMAIVAGVFFFVLTIVAVYALSRLEG